jgi:hypothetical protein
VVFDPHCSGETTLNPCPFSHQGRRETAKSALLLTVARGAALLASAGRLPTSLAGLQAALLLLVVLARLLAGLLARAALARLMVTHRLLLLFRRPVAWPARRQPDGLRIVPPKSAPPDIAP